MDYLIMPISGAIIGYFTNWIAIKMLFRPLNEKYIFGVKLPFTPGLIPKERKRLTEKISKTISTHLLTNEVLENAINSEKSAIAVRAIVDDFFDKLKDNDETLNNSFSKSETLNTMSNVLNESFLSDSFNLSSKIKSFLLDNPTLEESFKKAISKVIDENVGGFASIFVNKDKIYNKIKDSVVLYLESSENEKIMKDKIELLIKNNSDNFLNISFKQLYENFSYENIETLKNVLSNLLIEQLSKIAPYLVNSINIEEIMKSQIDQFSLQETETIILSVINKELRYITFLGGLLGFIIGVLTNFI